MRKKLVFGIVLVLILLLLMPSIPAIQINTNHLDFKEITQLNDDIKFPGLYKIISLWLNIRFLRFIIILTASGFYVNNEYEVEVEYPILFLRAIWLMTIFVYSSEFFQIISDRFGLNWRIPFI